MSKFSPDYYASVKFSCGNPKCYSLLVPEKIEKAEANDKVFIVGKCPECKKSYRFPLSLDKDEIGAWKPVLKDQMEICTKCGERGSLKVLSKRINDKNQYEILIECMECKKTQKRFIDPELFYLFEEDLPPSDQELSSCPNCGEIVDPSDSVCLNCGRDLYCKKCGRAIVEKAKFCVKCGGNVNIGDQSMQVLTQGEKPVICPNCNTPLTNIHRYCNECGQEIICNKCGEFITPGALFCHVCGDPVKHGKAI